MQPPVLFQPFDGDDFFLPDLSDLSKARVSGCALNQDRASAALAFAAPVFGARQVEVIPQDAEQTALGIGVHSKRFAVDVKFSDLRHKNEFNLSRR